MARAGRRVVSAIGATERKVVGSLDVPGRTRTDRATRIDVLPVRVDPVAMASPSTGGVPDGTGRRRGGRPAAGARARPSPALGSVRAARSPQRTTPGTRRHLGRAGSGTRLHTEPVDQLAKRPPGGHGPHDADHPMARATGGAVR